MPLFGRKEDLHRRLVVVDFLFPSTHFLRSPQYPSTCAGQVFSKHFPKLPNERSIKRSSLSQSTFNEPTAHHLSIPTIIEKTAPSKERGSSSSTRCRDFLRIPQYSFYLIHKQAFVTRHFIDRIPEVPKPSSLSPSTFKQSTTHHFIKSHHHNGGSLSGSLLRCRLASDPPPCRFLHLCNIANSPRLLNE